MTRIKDWSKFQHFKDRRPPWIKLYRDILDDVEWHELDANAAKALVMLWLIASENDGNLPEVKKIAFRLRMSESKTSELLSKLSHWLEQDDIAPISSRHQGDAPETERETETKTKKETKAESAVALLSSKGISEDLARDFLAIRKAKKAPLTETALAGIEREAAKAGYSLQKALETCCARGWQGFEAIWVQPKPGSVEARSATVPGPTGPDPVLEQIKAHKGAPIPASVREFAQQIKVKH